jgi:hypothetical protein
MKKSTLILCGIIFSATVSYAQTFSNTPNDTVQIAAYMEDLETLTISQLNTSADTITLKWKRVSTSVPANWDASICDNMICNTSLVNSGAMNPVVPNDYGFLLLHVTAHVNYGTAIIRYSVWDENYPAVKDTLTFIMTVNPPLGVDETENKNAFSISPNPANDNINIVSNGQTGFTYFISDISGRVIRKENSETNTSFVPVNNLQNGIYNISVIDKDKAINTKKIVVQH